MVIKNGKSLGILNRMERVSKLNLQNDMKISFLCGIVENVLFYGTENGLTKKMRDRFDGIYTRMFNSLLGGL